LSLRSAFVFLLAALTGAGAGALTVLAGSGGPQAVLYGVGACGLAVSFFDRVIGPDREPASSDTDTPDPARPPSSGR
jgi:hypothetical protein